MLSYHAMEKKIFRWLFAILILIAGLNSCTKTNCKSFDPSCDLAGLIFMAQFSPLKVFIASYTGNYHYSYNGMDWFVPQEKASSNLINDFTYGNGVFVGVGQSGTIIFSKDLNIWNLASSPTTNALNEVAFGNGRFVAAGPTDTILISTNGIDWTLHTTGFVAGFEDIDFGDGLFVISEQLSNNVYYSATGENNTWTQRVLSGGLSSLHIRFGNNTWLSSNGASDIEVFASDMQTSLFFSGTSAVGVNDLHFINGFFYHVSANGGTISRSASGQDSNWTGIATRCPDAATTFAIASIACKDDICVVVGSDSAFDRALCTSTSGPTGPYTNVTPIPGNPSYNIVRLVSTEPRFGH